MGIPSLLCVLFCHPFGAGSLLFLHQGLHPWLYPISPSGLLWGDPFRVATHGMYSNSGKAEALPYVKFV